MKEQKSIEELENNLKNLIEAIQKTLHSLKIYCNFEKENSESDDEEILKEAEEEFKRKYYK